MHSARFRILLIKNALKPRIFSKGYGSTSIFPDISVFDTEDFVLERVNPDLRDKHEWLFAAPFFPILVKPFGYDDGSEEFLDCGAALCCLFLDRVICLGLEGLHELLVVSDQSCSPLPVLLPVGGFL